MFVVSVSKNNIKKSLLIIFVVAILSLFFVLSINLLRSVQSSQTNLGITLSADSAQDRLAFISQYGWEVDEDPIEVREVVIPEEFDDVYENYNKIQLKQGFDLEKYAGQRVKRWTYVIRNYPETTPEDDYVRINLLVSDDVIIGGDVCSVKLDGFMHGFYR